MGGLLDGIKALEFSEVIAGPWGGMMLADLGADVIKVEPTTGEPWRFATPFAPSESRWFVSLNRGKRGLAINLRSPESRAIVERLVSAADVVIVNYRPDTPAQLGIDYETLSAINPALVYIEATAFGRQGPSSHRPGYDLIVQAVTGLMSVDGKSTAAGIPAPTSPPVADYGTGYAIAWAACAGLFNRERTGQGTKIEVSLLTVALGMLSYHFMEMPDLPKADAVDALRRSWRNGTSYEELEAQRQETQARLAQVNVYYRCYSTADSVIAVACLSDPLRKKFLQVTELDDPRLDGRAEATGMEAVKVGLVLVEQAEERMRERTTEEWLAAFDAAGVPAGPLNAPVQLVDDPQVLANDMVLEVEHPVAGQVRMLAPVLRPVGAEHRPDRASPVVGEHDEEILTEIGFTSGEIAALRDAGVVR